MSTAHSHKERRLPNSDKSDPVMNDHASKPKLDRGLFGNFLQLMFGHFVVRFIINALDFDPFLRAANNPLEFNCRACSGIQQVLRRFELRFCH